MHTRHRTQDTRHERHSTKPKAMILKFIITSALLTLMPGPDILFVVAQSMVRGKRDGIAIALGLSSGLFVHTAAAALGLSLLIASSPHALTVIKYAGIAYLTYLGFASLKSSKPGSETEAAPAQERRSFWKLYRTGVTMNLLNPKVIIFFLALFPQFVDPASPTPRTDVLTLGALFAAVAVTIFSTVALLADLLSSKLSVRKMNPRALAWIKASIYWALAVAFLFY